jgi:hypothetical protein
MSYKGDEVVVQELRATEIRGVPLVMVAAGTITLLADSPSVISVDCAGAARNLDMAAEEAAGMEGKLWIINNLTAATHALTVRNDAAGTIQAIAATKSALLMVMGGVWRVIGLVA